MGSVCPACRPGLGPTSQPHLASREPALTPPRKGGVSEGLCSQELASELLLMSTALHALLEACRTGVLAAGLPAGSGHMWGGGRGDYLVF